MSGNSRCPLHSLSSGRAPARAKPHLCLSAISRLPLRRIRFSTAQIGRVKVTSGAISRADTSTTAGPNSRLWRSSLTPQREHPRAKPKTTVSRCSEHPPTLFPLRECPEDPQTRSPAGSDSVSRGIQCPSGERPSNGSHRMGDGKL